MLTLITFPEGYGQPSVSPFCVKAMYLLNASGLSWKREDSNDPRRMPHAKLPVLRTNEGLVHDSNNIRAYLERQGVDFMPGLSDLDRSATHTFIRMAEEHMYFVQVLDRWERDEVWPTIRDRYFREIPKAVRGLITSGLRRKLMQGLNAQGLGRMTWDERMARTEEDLLAIKTRLSKTVFLFADTPTLADYSVAPVLAGMRGTPVATPLSRRIAGDTVLSDYIDRVDAAMVTS
jgi:glutathione S-transferase